MAAVESTMPSFQEVVIAVGLWIAAGLAQKIGSDLWDKFKDWFDGDGGSSS
jgi:hypothetical protein